MTTPRALVATVAALFALACTDLKVTMPGPVVSVRVSPDTLVLRIGDSIAVSVVALDADSALHSQEPVSWSSNAGTVASVGADGLVHALGAGIASISATVTGVTGSAVAIVTGQPAAIAAFAGTGQSAAVNSPVGIAPAVKVTDGSGNPVARVPVTFTVAGGGGSVTGGGPVFTDLGGVAAVGSWTLGPSPVTNSLSAMANGSGITGNPVSFTATATVGPPSAAMSTVSANPSAIAPSTGASLATVTVTVKDAAGSTITGTTVTIAVSGTGNIVNQPTDTTNAQGQATATFSSSTAETKTITATVNGSVVITQTATVIVSANAPSTIAVKTQPAGATSNTDFTTQPVIEFRDAFNNLVPTASGPVTVTLVSGNGTLVTSGTFTVNAVGGVATFSGLRIRGPRTPRDTLGTGPHVLQFATPGYNAVKSDTFQVAVSFSYNVVDVYTRNFCTAACHGSSGDFPVYANNFLNGNCGGSVPRVVAGNPASSLIYYKITPTPACGTIMPPSGALSQRQRDLIYNWILQGALNN